jgi:hypothetical protein
MPWQIGILWLGYASAKTRLKDGESKGFSGLEIAPKQILEICAKSGHLVAIWD